MKKTLLIIARGLCVGFITTVCIPVVLPIFIILSVQNFIYGVKYRGWSITETLRNIFKPTGRILKIIWNYVLTGENLFKRHGVLAYIFEVRS